MTSSILAALRDSAPVNVSRLCSEFFTAWAYLDHELIAPGGDTGSVTLADRSEAEYVMSGEGSVTVNGETVAIKKGDAIPVDVNQSQSFKAGAVPLELMIIGVAKDMAAKNAFAANILNDNPDLANMPRRRQ